MNKFLPIIFSVIFVCIFFWQSLLKGLLPIPADTIVGLYHPFRDLYSNNYPNGIPYKNFLITDPVRQQYPWKNLSINLEGKNQLPLWNSYEMAGKPLLGNLQSGSFYPLNFLFFIFPFNFAWGLFIFSQSILSTIFLYLFLRNLKVSKTSSFFGGIVFAFCGFSIAWLEWGNILHTILWLPIILLSIDKIILEKKVFKWALLFIFSLVSSFFAGHLQIFFYTLILSFIYSIFRLITSKYDKKKISFLLIYFLVFILITAFQWIPTFKFILESGRFVDQSWQKDGWFIPLKNIVQFIAPDFFGNPATLNYWGVWNYAEFVGYIGIFPLVTALVALFLKRSKIILFFELVLFISIIFSFPNFISKIPYILNIPFLSSAQPTRLIVLIDFSLAVLSAFGLDYITKNKKGIWKIFLFFGVIFLVIWGIVINSTNPNLLISKQNLIFPSILFVISVVLIFLKEKVNNLSRLIIYLLIIVTMIDLFRFGWKFTPFTNKEYLFPQTKIISFLQNQKGQFRIMSVDSRILPPNFASFYKLQSIEGYDPLYLKRYGELIASLERDKPDINPPFGFGRIITPQNYKSNFIDLLGVKYILSLTDLSSPKLKKIFQEGQTMIYENKKVFPRAFFVKKTIYAKDKNDAINKLFINQEDLADTAIVEEGNSSVWNKGDLTIEDYKENKIIIKTLNDKKGFLVLTDSYYSTWHAKIDGVEVKILRTDFNFRGIIVPEGFHKIEFYITLL